MIQLSDIEEIEGQLHAVRKKVAELDAMRAAWLRRVTQNGIEQVNEFSGELAPCECDRVEDIGDHPVGFDAMLEALENLDDNIADAWNHIQHALDIVADKLPEDIFDISSAIFHIQNYKSIEETYE